MNDEKATTTTTTGFGVRGAKAPPPLKSKGVKAPTPSRYLQE